jgi:hypothetical protein
MPGSGEMDFQLTIIMPISELVMENNDQKTLMAKW